MHAGHAHDDTALTRGGYPDLGCLNVAAGGFDAVHSAVGSAANAGHLAVFDDVHTQGIRGACITPRHGVVARGTAAALQGPPEPGIANVAGNVERRTKSLGLFGFEPFIVDTIATVGVHVA